MQEVNKTEQELFVEIIENNLKNNIHLLTDNNSKLEKETEYELLGGLCYYIGIGIWDFPKNEKTNTVLFNRKLIKSLEERLERINVKIETVTKILEKYRNTDIYSVDYWNKVNQINKDLINKELPTQDAFILSPLVKITCNTLTVPLGFVKDLNDVASVKLSALTYRHLLMLNNFIYNDSVDVNSATFDNLKQLQLLDIYNKAVKKATEYYNKQKYSAMFFDLILSMQEFMDYFKGKDFYEILHNIISDSGLEDEKVDDEKLSKIDEENENVFRTKPLLAIIKTINQEKKLNYDIDSISSNEQLFTILDTFENNSISEDLVMYLKQCKLNGLKFEWDNLDLTDLQTMISAKFKGLSERYKKEMELYMEDIPDNIKNFVVDKVNKVIRKLIIDGSEKKAYLYQQLLENGIETFKHLQQIIGLIEQCKIKFSDREEYNELVNYINTNSYVKEKFDLIEEIDVLNNETYYFQTLKNMF
nr:MAG TPA: hypothetical protein [Caudoviricetes sp.]